MLPLVLTLVSAVATLALVAAEVKKSTRGRYASKPIASVAFVLVAVLGGALAAPGPYGTWIVLGLVLGVGGDMALMFRSNRAFLVGLVLFLLGHVAYVVAFGLVVSPVSWLTPPAILAVVAGGVVLRYLWPHLGKMRGPVIAYTLVITLMVLGATAAVWAGATGRNALDDRAAWLLFAGALLFFVSDISVARDRFVARGPRNRIWGLPAYYGGQLLIAWSAIV